MMTMEIAERTGKEHRNVLRDTRKMLVELYGEESLYSFEQRYKAADNNMHPCYCLPKKEVACLAARYNIQSRKKVREITGVDILSALGIAPITQLIKGEM